MAGNYTELRDQLMHTNGTTPYETMSVIVPAFFFTTVASILMSIIQSSLIENLTFQFCAEFVVLVTPIVLNITILAPYTIQLLISYIVLCISLIVLTQNFETLKEKAVGVKKMRSFVTNARSTINVISVVAILAVDFRVFPRRFAKTENFGYSLMDVGVGLFVYSNGIVDGGRPHLVKSLKGSLPLLVLGMARFFAAKTADYHVPVSEYGVHWNFFITLFVTKILVTLLLNVISVKFIVINATLLLCSHEILLQAGLGNFVMSDVKRANFVTANREGLVSSLGYVSLYLFSVYFGYFLDVKNATHRVRTSIKFLLLSALTLLLSLLFESYFGISRKLANSAYCFWILFIGVFMTGLYYVGEIVQDYFCSNKLISCVYSPLIFEAINYNGLTFFLVSNLLTGLVNIVCDTLSINDALSLAIILDYMVINCALVCLLYRHQIKLKL